MATTVGATPTSSKLAVAQGDLHPVGSPGDQPIVRCDQATCKEFLATEQIGPNEAKRGHPRACAAISSVGIPISPIYPKEQSVPAPANKPVLVKAQICPAPSGKETPEGPSHPRRKNNGAGHRPHRLGALHPGHHNWYSEDTHAAVLQGFRDLTIRAEPGRHPSHDKAPRGLNSTYRPHESAADLTLATQPTPVSSVVAKDRPRAQRRPTLSLGQKEPGPASHPSRDNQSYVSREYKPCKPHTSTPIVVTANPGPQNDGWVSAKIRSSSRPYFHLTPAARILDKAAVERIYEQLRKTKKIQPLRPPPRPKQVHMIKHPRYCAYHRHLGHSTGECRLLTNHLEKMILAGTFDPDANKDRGTTAAIREGSHPPALSPLSRTGEGKEPIRLSLSRSEAIRTTITTAIPIEALIGDKGRTLFQVPAKNPRQKPILFERSRGNDSPQAETKDDSKEPDFSWVSSKVVGMMKRWGYRFEEKEGLNFGRGRRTVPGVHDVRMKGDHRGLGYSAVPDRSTMGPSP